MNRHGIEVPERELAALCRRRKIRSLAVFGSILRPDFRPESDIDLLVTFAPGSRPTTFDELIAIEEELEALLGREVDLVEREAVIGSPNYLRRRHILSTAEPIYVEG